MDTPDGGKALNYAVRKPLGVVAVISPWNLPLLLMTWKVAPANGVQQCGDRQAFGGDAVHHYPLGEVMNEVGGQPGPSTWCMVSGPNSAGRVSPAIPCARYHLHRRNAHRQRDHAVRRTDRESVVVRAGRQECGDWSLPMRIWMRRSQASRALYISTPGRSARRRSASMSNALCWINLLPG